MWYEEQKNGKFKYRDNYKDPLTGVEKKVSITLQDTKKKTQKLAEEILRKKIEKKLSTNEFSKQIKFKELSDIWIDIYKEDVKNSTYLNVQRRIKVVNDDIGDILTGKITPVIINKYLLKALKEHNRSYRTVAGDRSIIIRVIRFGIDQGYCKDDNYEVKVKVPKMNVTKKDKLKYLEQQELASLYEQLEDHGRYEVLRMCKIQVSTGMRYGEMVSLRYDQDIDLENKTISITRTYDGENHQFNTPKTGDSRLINITDETVAVIKEQIEYDKLKMIKHNMRRDNKLLFRQKNERPRAISLVNRTLKLVDIPGKVLSTHIFRHTFITRYVESGIDNHLIAEHVGHSSTKMIDEVYRHFSNKMADDLKEAVQKVKML